MEKISSPEGPSFSIKPYERRPFSCKGIFSQGTIDEHRPLNGCAHANKLYADQRVYSQHGENGEILWEISRPITQTTITELNVRGAIIEQFDQQQKRLDKLKTQLKSPSTRIEETTRTPDKIEGDHAVFPNFLLAGTLAYLDKVAHPPRLPARLADIFERDFRRVEAMFHTVFYRKYHPEVLADAKQEAFLGLYKKWLKNRHLLSQSSSYIVTAAVYSVSNWRQKSQEVRANERQLLIDNQGKVMGHTAVHGSERWTDRLDFQFDLANAVDGVLYQYEGEPDYRETYAVMRDIVDEVRFQQGQQALGLRRGQYMKKRNDLKEALRQHLLNYHPNPENHIS